ncbi:hypothetical protein EYF80_017103 [Liparis tanakae]|uniref:Uncharacterized protein n=1 Tax=Liparis tanakae TaxID=230148 RepID=A0A4Z2I5R8_9TELE|nr:hypothetical protein EYF80_017103 [Liparis tanakae]
MQPGPRAMVPSSVVKTQAMFMFRPVLGGHLDHGAGLTASLRAQVCVPVVVGACEARCGGGYVTALVHPLPSSVCLSACHPGVMPLSQPLGALLTPQHSVFAQSFGSRIRG